jgi:hypothetical protein
MMFYGIIDYATSYATLLLHNERGKSHFDNELISSIPRHLGCGSKTKSGKADVVHTTMIQATVLMTYKGPYGLFCFD